MYRKTLTQMRTEMLVMVSKTVGLDRRFLILLVLIRGLFLFAIGELFSKAKCGVVGVTFGV